MREYNEIHALRPLEHLQTDQEPLESVDSDFLKNHFLDPKTPFLRLILRFSAGMSPRVQDRNKGEKRETSAL